MVDFFRTIRNILWTQIVSKFIPPRGSISVGAFTQGKPSILTFLEEAEITIGKFCSFAHNVTIVGAGGMHHYWEVANFPLRHYFSYVGRERAPKIPRKERAEEARKYRVVIGNDVWVGTGAIILPNIHVGDGAVIGAGAVVTHSVPPYAIVAGVPAKILRYRFSQDQIKELQRISWWNWSPSKIIKNIEYFNDVEKFIHKFSKPQKN